MPTSNFGSAIKTGTGIGQGADAGLVVLRQTLVMNFTLESGGGNDNVDASMVLPPNSQIVDIIPDTLVAWDSVTSATLTAGSAAGGSQYAGAVDVKSDGREAPVFTAAQLAAMDDIGSNTTVWFRVAQVGNTSAGQVRVTVLYVQTN